MKQQKQQMTTEEFDHLMRSLTGEAALRPRLPKALPKLPQTFATSPSTRVENGSRIVVGLKGGGRVEGILARRVAGAVVIESEKGADVIILDRAGSSTHVRPRGGITST